MVCNTVPHTKFFSLSMSSGLTNGVARTGFVAFCLMVKLKHSTEVSASINSSCTLTVSNHLLTKTKASLSPVCLSQMQLCQLDILQSLLSMVSRIHYLMRAQVRFGISLYLFLCSLTLCKFFP